VTRRLEGLQRHGRIVNVSSVLGFLPAPYMGLYSASKHAVEGLSETLDHEVRQFGIRVTLVEPSYTRTNLEANSPQAKSKIDDYDRERDIASRSVADSVNDAPEPSNLADTIVEAAWHLAHAPHSGRTGIPLEQIAPLHACWPGRCKPEESAWTRLKSPETVSGLPKG
jgi:NAD(P)-dependent dehydrogenase (short-subunit alcohol dehydrogenase family)